MTRISASILNADFRTLGAHVCEALQADVDWLHMDVMDGRFVPNITFGPLVVKALRSLLDDFPEAMMDVHLMIEEPERHLEAFVEAGADLITVHMEVCRHLHRTVQAIHELGAGAGVALNPATPLVSLQEILPDLDLILIMSVNPGFGGQSYIEGSTKKIARLRKMLDEAGSEAFLSVDGGIKPHNAMEIAGAGADILVVGSAIFEGQMPVAEAAGALRKALTAD